MGFFGSSSARARFWPIALLVGAAVGAPAGAAVATTAEEPTVTWSVAPADENGPDGRSSVDLALDPGTSTTESLAVRNFSEQEVTFALTAADGYYTSTGRFNMLAASDESIDAGTWISVEPALTLAAGETRVVPYTITVPANATPGDHAAGIAASVRTTSADADGTQVGVDSRVGFRVSTRVTGDLAPALEVSDVRADYRPSWSLFAPGRVAVSYVATNTGNTTLAVSDTLGETASEQGNLLPGEKRNVSIAEIPAWPLGLLFFDLAVDGSVPGETLTATPYTQSLVVWAIPWLYLLAAVGVFLILFAIFTGRRRNKRRFERLLQEAREEGRKDSTEKVPTA
ncbi:WxL protein peptidoglycan domain-containing protein [Microbacterium sp. P06]|uniref:WxL protein peptidoglycan domain-containing protein n=1 Tax=Microbacterium sp. P06 TaxID=3366949 RepID=UPI00374621E0